MNQTRQLRERAAIKALDVLPKNLVSRAFGKLCELELPGPLQAGLNEGFAALYDIDTEEAERAPSEYATLNGFFTRRLKPGARAIDASDDALVSPVDGRLTQRGRLDGGTLIQAKGRAYRLVELVDSAAEADVFARGSWATIYLSPQDYHRIHSPAAGVVRKVSYIPGHLWPVNPLSVRHVERLFAINERLISYLETERFGRVAVIKVGATCVGRIGLSFSPIESNGGLRRRQELELTTPVEMDAGEEMATFNLGSTVILLVESPDFAFDDTIATGDRVTMGQRIGART